MSTWYRIQDADRDPQSLLDPATWVSATWVSATWTPDREQCPACDGAGSVPGDEDDDGFFCQACDGHGDIARQPRRGVSACATIGELARYMDGHWGDVRGTVIIELEGDLSDDDDHDDDAVLVLPERIVSVTPVAQVPEMAGVLARDEAQR